MKLIDAVNNKKCSATVQEVYDLISDNIEETECREDTRTLIAWLPFVDELNIYTKQPYFNKPVVGGSRNPHIDLVLSNGETVKLYTNLENEFQNMISEKTQAKENKRYEYDR